VLQKCFISGKSREFAGVLSNHRSTESTDEVSKKYFVEASPFIILMFMLECSMTRSSHNDFLCSSNEIAALKVLHSLAQGRNIFEKNIFLRYPE
jgi:hypothetical protein